MAVDEEGIRKEEAVVAVVLADGFGDQFGPVLDDRPQCLLPVANGAVLDYTLDVLRKSGVHQTIIYCTRKLPEVKIHVSGRPNVTVVSNHDSRSLGDALRDLDGKAVLRDHFILVTDGGVVGNVDLGEILKIHKARAAREDKNAAVTLVMKEALTGLRTREQEVLMATKREDGRVLHYSKPKGGLRKFSFPLEVFQDEDVELRFDLVHSGVAICSPTVPPLFSDNFDCQTLGEFVKGTIEDDLTDHTIYAHCISDHGYLAKISDFQSLKTLGRDVLNRWPYPQVPANIYKMSQNNVYKTSSTCLDRDCHLEEETIVGPNSAIGSKTFITRSSIGSGCKIGPNVIISDCIILDDVVIENNCKLDGCVIGSKAKIGSGSSVGPRAVLGPGVEISGGMTVPQDTWLSSESASGFDDGSEEPSEFGPNAYHFDIKDSDDESDDGVEPAGNVWGDVVQTDDEDEDDSTDSEDESDISGLADQTGGGGAGDILMDVDAKLEIFQEEVLESLQRGADEGINVNNLVLEINSSRHAYAVTTSQVVQTVISGILTVSLHSSGSSGAKALLQEVKKSLEDFSGVIGKYVKNVNSEVDLLKGLEKFFEENSSSSPSILPIVGQVVHHMYDTDVVSEPAIVRWNQSIGQEDSDGRDDVDQEFSEKLKEKLKPLIAWLEEEDSSDDSE